LGFTVNRAAIANEYVRKVYGENTGFTMYGGVVMNKVIGGVNPEAVEKGLKLGAKVIWLPTQSAKRHMEKMGQDPANGIELVRDGKVVPDLMDVFRLIRDYDVVLGTAHVSPEEAFIVVEAARDAGIKKIVITHPEWWVCDYSIEDQIRLVKDYDVILERCYAQNMGKGKPYHLNLKENAELIQEIGYEHVMADTDGGQTENPDWETEMYEYMHYLVEYGIPIEQVYHMTKTIPYRLLGIEEEK
jgi:urease gamma subunit